MTWVRSLGIGDGCGLQDLRFGLDVGLEWREFARHCGLDLDEIGKGEGEHHGQKGWDWCAFGGPLLVSFYVVGVEVVWVALEVVGWLPGGLEEEEGGLALCSL